jgi:hypothetical protein
MANYTILQKFKNQYNFFSDFNQIGVRVLLKTLSITISDDEVFEDEYREYFVMLREGLIEMHSEQEHDHFKIIQFGLSDIGVEYFIASELL